MDSGLILASTSPRRIDILNKLDIKFEVISSNVDESVTDIYSLDIPLKLSYEKAYSVSLKHPDRIVAGFDTVVVFKEKVYGKPVSIAEAESFLLAFSGKTHSVITGVSIIFLSKNIFCCFAESTFVKFKNIDLQTAREYCSRVNVLDKAGGYAIQEYGDMLVESVSGDIDNVIGLPAKRFIESLRVVRNSLAVNA